MPALKPHKSRAQKATQDAEAKQCAWNPERIIQTFLAAITFGLLVVGLLQWCTFDRTRVVLDNTDKTLSDTLETNRLQTRATVYIRLAAWTDENIPRTRMSIGNSGLVATKNLSFASACNYSDKAIVDPFKDGRERMASHIVEHYTLGPHALDEGIPICGLGEAKAPAPEFIYVFGYARYDDTFTKKPRYTQFCWRVDPPPVERMKLHGNE